MKNILHGMFINKEVLLKNYMGMPVYLKKTFLKSLEGGVI